MLDAPGGINILTIHAFCQALLKRFPLEAGVPPGFEVMDEAEAATLLRHAQDEQVESCRTRRRLARAARRAGHRRQPHLDRRIRRADGRLLGERAWLLERIGTPAGLKRVAPPTAPNSWTATSH